MFVRTTLAGVVTADEDDEHHGNRGAPDRRQFHNIRDGRLLSGV